MNSESLQISKAMVSLLERHGITTATPVQLEIIPAIVEGRDVIAQSETGSGKTLSFAIPLIEKCNRKDGLRVLVVVPTRELAVQVAAEFTKFSQGKQLGITSIYGGVSIGEQQKKLARTNIIVGTPGRLLDLLERRTLDLGAIRTLVLDEADRMLDMGFIKDIERIMRRIPAERQTLLFSATIAPEIVQISRKYLRNPKQVALPSKVKPEFLHQTYYQTTTEQKQALLVHLLKGERELALVFCNRKHVTTRLAQRLTREGLQAQCLNGNMTQGQRERTTEDFKRGRFTILVATDVAARGLHIDNISHVYNYEIPKDVESYTHRVGRTARAGKKGEAISLVSNGEERSFFQQILFSYKGSITLKTAQDTGFIPIISPEPSRHPATAAPERKRTPAAKSSTTWSNYSRPKRRTQHAH